MGESRSAYSILGALEHSIDKKSKQEQHTRLLEQGTDQIIDTFENGDGADDTTDTFVNPRLTDYLVGADWDDDWGQSSTATSVLDNLESAAEDGGDSSFEFDIPFNPTDDDDSDDEVNPINIEDDLERVDDVVNTYMYDEDGYVDDDSYEEDIDADTYDEDIDGDTFEGDVYADEETKKAVDMHHYPAVVETMTSVVTDESTTNLPTAHGNPVLIEKGMGLVEFLRKNPAVRDIIEVKAYYSSDDIQHALDKGLVYRKKGRLII